VIEAGREYQKIAHKAGLTTAQMAIAWACSRWYMGSAIIGATTLEQLKENIKAASVQLSQETLDAIEAVHLVRRNPQCLD
jgi:aryl-alcohol dehydrogenase-like predicted oxidoreductase